MDYFINHRFTLYSMQGSEKPNGSENRGNRPKRVDFMKFYCESERSLSLYQGQLNDEDLKVIMDSELCIDILWLSINNITEIGAEYLAKRKLNLKELYLSWNSLGLEGTKQLSSANWPRLKKIWLVNNQIGPKGVKYIAKANWKCLEELNVGLNNINDEGCTYLMRGDWKNLKKLWIAQNNITQNGVLSITKANWPNLTHFSLWCNLISFEGCKTLQKVDWKNLISLNILRNRVDPSDVNTIRNMFLCKTQAEIDL